METKKGSWADYRQRMNTPIVKYCLRIGIGILLVLAVVEVVQRLY